MSDASPNIDFTSAPDNFKETHPEPKGVLKEALDEMRKEMRARVGRKLLSIEVHQHTDEEPPGDEPDDDAQPDSGTDPKAVRKMGTPLI